LTRLDGLAMFLRGNARFMTSIYLRSPLPARRA
jgi:hypothetical protein